ncbi:MAG TPA: trehalose-phosphatase [Plasticicumulans sp.]|uniref:trehalose-phosphatase n=1 Tax=Plasticicumulans sp. TaxID=2307179 RepID=UPI002CD2D43C|nr:trehalose-phosphatase [Plasticicumulans sp.]HMZ10158.1 trehalose-phosphatase [Plasticicumulans sp.]
MTDPTYLPPPPVPDAPWALFLDVDGTLIELAGRPDAVAVPPELPLLLNALDEALGGALALVSGRALAEVETLFAPHRYAIAGGHGAEWRPAADAAIECRPKPALAAARKRLEAFVCTHPGTLLETKPHALALHWRNAPAAESEALACMASVQAGLDSGFRLLRGKSVCELLPEGFDKGAVVAGFCTSPPFAGRVPVFIGDDVTDEAGFAAVLARGGIAVHVGTAGRPTCATCCLTDPAAVRAWLARDVLPACQRYGVPNP